jgi:hypothetical protein
MGYLRIDGEEVELNGARLVWQRATSGGRRGFLFQVTAHGRRRMLHLAAWAPGDRLGDLTGQMVPLLASGPDAAVDGRLFAAGEVRFGRVRDDLAILSVDGIVEALDPESDARSRVEADIRATVTAILERTRCVACGGALGGHVGERDEFAGGHRVRRPVLPVVCPGCVGFAETPRHCPTCGEGYDPDDVQSLGDASSLAYTATCPAGHTFSGNLIIVG